MVVPLVDGDELFGIFEILSPLPNAFPPTRSRYLEHSGRPNCRAEETESEERCECDAQESGLVQHKLERVVLNTNRPLLCRVSIGYLGRAIDELPCLVCL